MIGNEYQQGRGIDGWRREVGEGKCQLEKRVAGEADDEEVEGVAKDEVSKKVCEGEV